MESVKAGHDPKAVTKLCHPYRTGGPNPRPDVLAAVFTALRIVGAKSS